MQLIAAVSIDVPVVPYIYASLHANAIQFKLFPNSISNEIRKSTNEFVQQ